MSTKTEQKLAERKAKQEAQATRGRLLIEADTFKLNIRTEELDAAERTLARMQTELKGLRTAAANGRPARSQPSESSSELITK